MNQNLRKILYRLPMIRKTHVFIPTKMLESRLLLKFLNPGVPPGEKIIDVACGAGLYSRSIALRGASAYGVDADHGRIDVASSCRARGCNYVVGNAESLPFKSYSFDKALCACALEHFLHDDKALDEMNRILKVGGVLALSVDSFSCRSADMDDLRRTASRQSEIVRFYSREELGRRLESAGFVVEEMTHFANSRFARLITSLQIRMNSGFLFIPFFPLVYLGCLISENFFGSNNQGFFLACSCRKVKATRSDHDLAE